ncbi:MAG TPA: PmoA family protein [Thermoguttaceae bacterium]|nr:PmoA family protein [Thermoguttaceae bacterium]
MRHLPSRHTILRATCVAVTLLTLVESGRAEQEQRPHEAQFSTANAKQEELLVEVVAGRHDRQRTPIFLELPEALRDHTAFSLVRIDTDRVIDVQVLAGETPRLVWILAEPLPAGSVRRYRLVPSGASREKSPTVTCRDNGRQILLAVGDRPVLNYNHVVVDPPPGIDAHYRRGGHIHPLFSPAGIPVTDDFAPDHAHQHGVFFAWVNTTFEGRPIDFWNQAKEQGQVEHIALKEPVSGPVFGQFVATLRHSDMTAPDGPKPVLEETWTVRVYNVREQFVIDFESRQRCVADHPLAVNEYHYGGMAIRGSRQWFGQPGADFVTSEGKTREDGNHTRPRWVEMYGKVDGRPSGVLVMGDPSNFRSPQPVRLPPEKPYFCFAPMVLGPFEIKPGEEYVSRYRYCTHDGSPDTALADRLWNDYGHPPEVRLRRVKP